MSGKASEALVGIIGQSSKALFRAIIRRSRPVTFANPSETTPVSRAFGLDRGVPIDRHYIGEFLSRHSDAIRGEALEVGETKYLRQFGGLTTSRSVLVPSLDALSGRGERAGTLVADLSRIPPDIANRFDTFVCTQTLNFIADVDGAVQGARTLLKVGGIFLGTVAGISQVSRYDASRWGDYWRFTPQGIGSLLRRHFGETVQITEFGNLTAALALLQGLAVEDLPSPDLLAPVDPDYPVILGFLAHKTT